MLAVLSWERGPIPFAMTFLAGEFLLRGRIFSAPVLGHFVLPLGCSCADASVLISCFVWLASWRSCMAKGAELLDARRRPGRASAADLVAAVITGA